MKVIKKIAHFIPLILLSVVILIKSFNFEIHDFANYYFGAFFLKEGLFDINIYFPYEFNYKIHDLGYKNIFGCYSPQTPILATLFLPFTGLNILIAKFIFNTISILLLSSLNKLVNHFKINRVYLFFIPIIFFVPIKNNILFGQFYFILLFLLIEGFLAYLKNNKIRTVIFWSLAITIKLTPILLFIYLAYKKDIKTIIQLALSCFLIVLTSLLFVEYKVWEFYFLEVITKANNGNIINTYADNFQSVLMFLRRCFIYDEVVNKNVLINSPALTIYFLLIIKLIAVAFGYILNKKSLNPLVLFSYWLTLFVLLSPSGSTYYLVLLIPFFFSLSKSNHSNYFKIAICILLFLICNIPAHFYLDFKFPFSYLRLFLLITMMTLYFYNYIKKYALKIGLISLIGSLLVITFSTKKIDNSELLLEDSPILIYNYNLNNSGLEYVFWSQNGEMKKTTPYNYNIQEELSLVDNQIYYKNTQLTFNQSNKVKPILVDNKVIIYLSDNNRGLGFYTLKQIKLTIE